MGGWSVGERGGREGKGRKERVGHTCQLISCAGALISHVLQGMQLHSVSSRLRLIIKKKKKTKNK